MNRQFTKLAAATASVFALGVTGVSLNASAGGDLKSKTTTQSTTQNLDGTTTTTTTTKTERLNSLNGAIVRDYNGAPVGTVQSFTNANGEVVANVVNPSGATSTLSLGAPEVLVTEIPASGSVSITVDQSGKYLPGRSSTTTTITK